MTFKPSQTITEKTPDGEVRVVKIDQSGPGQVQAYQMQQLGTQKSYSEVRGKYGPLAVTDSERTNRNQRDSRFSLNPMLRDKLSVEDEERRIIEERVRTRVAEIEQEAREKATQQGYEEGFRQGQEEATARFSAEAQTRLEHMDSLLAVLECAKEEIYQANERFLMEMVFRIARMVVLKEVTTDREYVQRLCQALLERIGVRENIRIRLNPEDVEVMASLKEGLEKKLGALKNLSIETSPQVAGGGCMIETGWNAIDASIDTQLKNLHDSLIAEKSAPTAAGEGAQ